MTGTTQDTEIRRTVAREIADIMSSGEVPPSMIRAEEGFTLPNQPFAIFFRSLLNYVPEENRDEFNLELDSTFYDDGDQVMQIFLRELHPRNIEEGPGMTTCIESKAKIQNFQIDYFYSWMSEMLRLVRMTYGTDSHPSRHLQQEINDSETDILTWFRYTSAPHWSHTDSQQLALRFQGRGEHLNPTQQNYFGIGSQNPRIYEDVITASTITLQQWELPLEGAAVNILDLGEEALGVPYPKPWFTTGGRINGYTREQIESQNANNPELYRHMISDSALPWAQAGLHLWSLRRYSEVDDALQDPESPIFNAYAMLVSEDDARSADIFIEGMETALERIHSAVRERNDPIADRMNLEELQRDEMSGLLDTYIAGGEYAWNAIFGRIGDLSENIPDLRILDACGKPLD